MNKIKIFSAGGYEKLIFTEEEDPKPQPNEILIDVHYSGVNYADCLVRWGVYESAKKLVGWPITPGFEVSGVVKEVGSRVSKFKVGDKVIGITLFGGYSNRVCVLEDNACLLPSKFTMAEGAGFPAVYMTAYYALFQIARVPKNALVLIHSAAGGVGSALVQLCSAYGFRSVGVVGNSKKIEHVKKLGAEKVYDKSDPNFDWTQIKNDFPDGFDVVLDANGYTTLKVSYDLLRPTGKLMIYGSHSLLPKQGGRMNYLKAAWGLLKTPRYNPMDLVTDNKSIICFNVSFLFKESSLISENLSALLNLIEQDKLAPPFVNVFNFKDTAKAHQLIESGTSVGKIILQHT